MVKLTVDQMELVEQIETQTGDTHSRGAFVRIVREVSEQTVYQALSITRAAMAENVIHRPGGYFLKVIEAISGFSFRPRSSGTHEYRSSEPPRVSLDGLSLMYAHLRVRELWGRYKQLQPSADLDDYRLFLQRHHAQVWQEKPHYRCLAG